MKISCVRLARLCVVCALELQSLSSLDSSNWLSHARQLLLETHTRESGDDWNGAKEECGVHFDSGC